MKKDLTNLSATLEQITKVQPNFIGPWQFQAWNLSYNVAAAFDDYHDKYYWVIRGINFLKEGVEHNENEPRLYWRHRLVHLPQDRHAPTKRSNTAASSRRTTTSTAPGPWTSRDNWLVGKEWYREGREAWSTRPAS